MTQTTLHLDGVALRQHDESYLFDYRPYAHQLALSELVRGDEGFVAVNDSPTGGGKTSSWLAPALTERLDTIAIYPTNALVVDQTEQVKRDAAAVDHDVSVLTVTSENLAEKRDDFGEQSNGEVINQWYRTETRRGNQVILLTNPDIFVMMCRDLYHNASRAYKQFPFVVVDEFHRAGQKEQNTLRYLLDELYERDKQKRRLDKVAFLSATPDEKQEEKFEHAMTAPYHRVTETDSKERKPFSDSVGDGWHGVMPPVELDVRIAPTFGTADVLLEETESLLSFCENQEGNDDEHERVAIILDGIHEVKRVYENLNDELDRQVERIDGFHSQNKKEKLQTFDVLVSNSAVEVGIDFEIDRLLFAGHNKASFLQRLGRLRNKTNTCHARCYVPREIAHALSEYDSQRLTRRELDEVLEAVYPEPRQPESFGWRYSAPEELRHIDKRIKNVPSDDERKQIALAGQNRVRRHFIDGTDVRLDSDDIKRTKESIDWQVLDKLQWYRGDSIQALVYDQIEETVRTYDLFYLLRYGRVEFLPKEKFQRIVPDEYDDTVARNARYVDGFCLYHGTIETTDEGWGRSVAFTGPRLNDWLTAKSESSRAPSVIGGVKLQASPSSDNQERVRTLDIINDRLQSRQERTSGDGGGLLCYPVSTRPTVTKERYDLGNFFFLYPIALQGETAGSLALGTDALYLHCHVMEEQESSDDEFIGL